MSHMSNQEKAIYALLANNVYWDVRSSNKDKVGDYSQSNWTPVPDGWTVLGQYDVSGSGSMRKENPELNGFTARAFQKEHEIVIAFAK